MSTRHTKRKASSIERFGKGVIAFNQKPVPIWVNILAEILLGWIPLVALIALGVAVYVMNESIAIPAAILLLIILLTWWAARRVQISGSLNSLRLPALGVLLLIGFFLSGSVDGEGTKKAARKNKK